MLPHVLLLCAVTFWGWTFVATKILLGELGPIEILALRLAIGVPFLGLALVARRVRPDFERRDIGALVLGGAILTAHMLIQIAALLITTATNGGWIISVTPLTLTVLSWLFLRERIGWSAVTGIAVATCGILLLISRGHLADLQWLRNTGDWLMLASTLTWAAYTVVSRDVARRRDPLAVVFAMQLVVAAFIVIVVAGCGELPWVRALSWRGIEALLYLAIVGLAVAGWFWQVAVARLGAARAGLYLYLEPLATVTLAVPLLHEPFGVVAGIGGALVLAGVYLGQRSR